MEVRGYSDYYPYGMVLRSGGTDYRYGYQGAYAEKDGETDRNAFELRMYDSRIARWLTTDPAGQYYSPYIAMGNDPVNGTDPDGAYTHAGAILRWVGGGFKGSVFHQNNGYAAGQWGIETKGPSQSFYDPKSSLNGVSVSEKVDYGHIDYPEIDNAISAYDNARQLEMQTAYRSSHPWGREALGDDLVGQAFGWYAGGETLKMLGGVFGAGTNAGRVFWSGGGNQAVETAARQFATENGMSTLEMTRAGKNLTNLTKEMAWEEKAPMWRKLSSQFAKGAKGTVHVFQNSGGISTNSVWGTVEYQILRQKEVHIIYHMVP